MIRGGIVLLLPLLIGYASDQSDGEREGLLRRVKELNRKIESYQRRKPELEKIFSISEEDLRRERVEALKKIEEFDWKEQLKKVVGALPDPRNPEYKDLAEAGKLMADMNLTVVQSFENFVKAHAESDPKKKAEQYREAGKQAASVVEKFVEMQKFSGPKKAEHERVPFEAAAKGFKEISDLLINSHAINSGEIAKVDESLANVTGAIQQLMIGLDPASKESARQFSAAVSYIRVGINLTLAAAPPEGTDRSKFVKTAFAELGNGTTAALESRRLKRLAGRYAKTLTLAEVIGETWCEVGSYAWIEHMAMKEHRKAQETYRKSVLALDARIRDLEAEKRMIEETLQGRPPAEPGGIKFGSVEAERIAVNLDVSAIRYDPARGTLIVSGRRSEHEFGIDLLVTALRLAVERHDPFFSLDPVQPRDYDAASRQIMDRVEKTWLQTRAGQQRLIDGMTALCRWPVGERYYFAPLSQVDPESAREILRVRQDFDPREKLVFSPAWLSQTRFGDILFRADVAIKSIATGLIYEESDGSLRRVDVPGYNLEWLFDDLESGRVNLELDDAVLRMNGGAIDLSQVRPKLVKVHRARGTLEDRPPCERCRHVVDHFDRTWEQYIRQVPVFAELTMAFRAYVAAKMLVQRHPGLVQRILQIPREQDRGLSTLYRIDDPVLWVSVQNGKVTTFPGKPFSVFLGMGAAGGISFNLDRRLRLADSAEPIDPWVRGTILGPSRPYVEEADRGAVLLSFSVSRLSDATQCILWLTLIGACLLVAAGGYFRSNRARAFAPPVCAHCARMHRPTEAVVAFCDIVAAGTTLFVLSLPFVAAWHGGTGSMGQIATAALMVAALFGGAAAAAYGAARVLARLCKADPRRVGMLSSLGAGARLLGWILAFLLLSVGLGSDVVSNRVIRLLGSDSGERVLAALGGTEILSWALILLLASAVVALAARWIVPLLFRSRPLLFARPH